MAARTTSKPAAKPKPYTCWECGAAQPLRQIDGVITVGFEVGETWCSVQPLAGPVVKTICRECGKVNVWHTKKVLATVASMC